MCFPLRSLLAACFLLDHTELGCDVNLVAVFVNVVNVCISLNTLSINCSLDELEVEDNVIVKVERCTVVAFTGLIVLVLEAKLILALGVVVGYARFG